MTKITLVGFDVWGIVLEFFEINWFNNFLLSRVSKVFNSFFNSVDFRLFFANQYSRHKTSKLWFMLHRTEILHAVSKNSSDEFIDWCMDCGFKFPENSDVERFIKQGDLSRFQRFLTKHYHQWPRVSDFGVQRVVKQIEIIILSIQHNKIHIFKWLMVHLKHSVYWVSNHILDAICTRRNAEAFEFYRNGKYYADVSSLFQFARHSCFNNTTIQYAIDREDVCEKKDNRFTIHVFRHAVRGGNDDLVKLLIKHGFMKSRDEVKYEIEMCMFYPPDHTEILAWIEREQWWGFEDELIMCSPEQRIENDKKRVDDVFKKQPERLRRKSEVKQRQTREKQVQKRRQMRRY